MNKYYNQIVTSPFFLTRQTANLMEDFSRELKAGAALFLLYGESDVGKTRLLQELRQNRLADRQVHWLDLSENSANADSMPDHGRIVEIAFSDAQQGDIIIADHFEKALKKTRHQLFLSWSTEGVDKQLNLIVASASEGFNELRQLAQHYQVTVQSFEQKPFSADETNAFVGFYLFPDRPIGKLSIPANLRKQLAATEGAAGRIIKILERDGGQIGSSSMTATASSRRGGKTIAAVFIGLMLAIGAGWYFIDRQPGMVEVVTEAFTIDAGPQAIVEPIVEPLVKPVVETGTVTEANVKPATGAAAAVEVQSDAQQPSEADLDAEPGVTDEVENVTVLEVEEVTEPAEITEPVKQGMLTAEPGTASDTDAILVQATATDQPETTVPPNEAVSEPVQLEPELSNKSRFQRELDLSYSWVTGKAGSTGTLQILLLSFKTFDEAAYHEYVDALARKQVDISRLRIFKTYTGGAKSYSVFYGEYASRQAALKAVNDLPAALRKISPIPRSVGGILQEIRRLETDS